MLADTLRTLCALPGISGYEDAVRDYIMEQAAPYASSMRIDPMGTLLIEKKGAVAPQKKILLAAHMDEVGLMIRTVTAEGYLKFGTVGGIDRRVLPGKQVLVGGSRIPGVIGLKAYHLTENEERKNAPPVKELLIDIGANSREEAMRFVQPGDPVVFDTDITELCGGMLKAKAIDDRIGCAVMLELIRRPLPVDCTFAFTVQEEVGTRGAQAVSYAAAPDITLILEGTTAADLPDMKPHQKVCGPGRGPVIPFMDGGTVYDRELYRYLTDMADANGIPWQTKEYISGGTDASAFQKSRAGVRVAAISAAVRYLHTPSSVACLQDCENILRLAELFLANVISL